MDKSWNVLLLLVFSRLPSEELYPCIEFYVQNSTNTLNTQLTQRCLEMMRLCQEIGPVHEVPSIETMKRILVPLDLDYEL